MSIIHLNESIEVFVERSLNMCLNNSDFAFINKQLQEEYSIANYFKHFQSRLLNPRSLEKSLKSLMKFFISHFLLNVPIAKRIFERRTFK